MKCVQIAAWVLLAGGVLSACGGAEPDQGGAPANIVAEATAQKPAAATRKDPCAYISAADVTAITTDVVTRTSASGPSCTYHADPDDGAEITIHVGDGVKQLDIVRKTIGLLSGVGKEVGGQGGVGADTEALLSKDESAVPALGDEALWGPNTTLAVLKGDVLVQVTPPLMHDPATHTGIPLIPRTERRKIAQQIAEKILANLDAQGR